MIKKPIYTPTKGPTKLRSQARATMKFPIIFLFQKNEATEAAYVAVGELVGGLPDVVLEEKKTCVHFSVGKGAFLGVHPRKQGVRLTIPLTRQLPENRVAKCEQVSANRFHNEVDLLEGGIDPDLAEWIREAYELKKS